MPAPAASDDAFDVVFPQALVAEIIRSSDRRLPSFSDACRFVIRAVGRGVAGRVLREFYQSKRDGGLCRVPFDSLLYVRREATVDSHSVERLGDQNATRPAAASASARLSAHGLLPPAQLAEVREHALGDAVLPCSRALVGRPLPGSPVATLGLTRGQLPAL
jgi:hypothetical protein